MKKDFLLKVSSPAEDFYQLLPFLAYDVSTHNWVTGKMCDLRANATQTEVIVAKYLYQQRVRFISQAPFLLESEGKHKIYFADFYIPAVNTIVEIDGRSHDMPGSAERDKERDALFAKYGIQTIRIRSYAVMRRKFKDLIPIPAENYLRPKKRERVVPEGVSGKKEARMRKLIGELYG